MLKPIETTYRGFRFRSRLEARWAVFFDHAGVRFDYEPEGFELFDGLRYLPDFFLPDMGVWVEVKPHALADAQCEQKAMALSYLSKRPVYVTNGAPGAVGTLWYTVVSGGGEVNMINCAAVLSLARPFGLVAEKPFADDLLLSLEGTDLAKPAVFGSTGPLGRLPLNTGSVLAARGARFEFGESGAAV